MQRLLFQSISLFAFPAFDRTKSIIEETKQIDDFFKIYKREYVQHFIPLVIFVPIVMFLLMVADYKDIIFFSSNTLIRPGFLLIAIYSTFNTWNIIKVPIRVLNKMKNEFSYIADLNEFEEVFREIIKKKYFFSYSFLVIAGIILIIIHSKFFFNK